MLLACLILAVQGPVVRPQYDLANYLAAAAYYRSPDRSAARREIRKWRSAEIEAAFAALRKAEDRLRAVPVQPSDIDFRTVEAAVLLHADVGFAALQASSFVDAKYHLDASVDLFEWSRQAAARARDFTRQRALLDARHGRPTPGLEIRETIDPADFYQALAATALAVGFPLTARPFAEEAVRADTMDPAVHLLSGCVNATLAEEFALRRRDSDARRAREAAEKALRDALALDPGLQEASLRLGRLLLDQRRAIEAELLLAEVGERGADDRQRYLARLFLGRVAESLGRPEEAVRLYGRALEAWPDSQAARLALAHALERSSGPAGPLVLVGATLEASRRPDRTEDPWWLYLLGPPGLARTALDRVWKRTLDR